MIFESDDEKQALRSLLFFELFNSGCDLIFLPDSSRMIP
jgi:hypothetical protein